MINITTIIIGITCVVSFISFSNEQLTNKLIFYPPPMKNDNQWYRFITCGFIHADIAHLAFNMYSFYMFGKSIEDFFDSVFGNKGKLVYLVLYLTALIVCLIPTYIKNINNYYYKSLGASGAVSAIIFSFIFLAPTQGIGLIIIPGLSFPAFAFGAIYLGVSAYLSKKGNSHINHSAHFWGAIYGIVFIFVSVYLFAGINTLSNFIHQIKMYF